MFSRARAIAAAPAHCVTAPVATETSDGTLLRAALARSLVHAIAAAPARCVAASIVTQSFDGALLRAVRAHSLVCAITAALGRRVTARSSPNLWMARCFWQRWHTLLCVQLLRHEHAA